MRQVFTTLLAPSCMPWPPQYLSSPEGLFQPFPGKGFLAQQRTDTSGRQPLTAKGSSCKYEACPLPRSQTENLKLHLQL